MPDETPQSDAPAPPAAVPPSLLTRLRLNPYLLETIGGVAGTVVIFALVYGLALSWYIHWCGGNPLPKAPPLSVTTPQSAHAIIQFYQGIADNYIHDNSPGSICLSLSIALGALVAGLAAYKILPRKDANGVELPSTPLGAIISASVALLTVLSSNANTYYSTTKDSLNGARTCKASLATLELDIPGGDDWSNKDASKEKWIQALKALIEKYPQVLYSTDLFSSTEGSGAPANNPRPSPVATPTNVPKESTPTP